MYFKQFSESIPNLDSIRSSRESQIVAPPEHCHVLIVVRRGHIKISSGHSPESFVCTQGYAGHADRGPYVVQVPNTKQAEYTVIYYRILPDGRHWDLHGLLTTISEIKIHYMLDELLRTNQLESVQTFSGEEEAAQICRKRMMLERILFIFIYESHIRTPDVNSSHAIEESISYINEHYMLKLTLPMLARRAGMSAGHYTVLFKQATGRTMTAYLRSIRIEKAKQMFRETGQSAKEIAGLSGFTDYFHFSRVFKQETGFSPTAFQQTLLDR
ncbi:helix-turn-helix domain-containing protein [Paenibacillus montanisoli]|uniref:AraC family transcriptional regulator n=1 Tax=Paenibacillus montanisoli TaxID=2081970 RepID=A0A328TX38_9BACL|nr:AraC family transcriptional regulator [Paenibacillus montanisoli]RAP73651.1 AraC family transcriptional regulator [Paenibacillus montanisoli]